MPTDGLFYQGNYNVTRFCRDRETEFARLALERLRHRRVLRPSSSSAAAVAYGCPMPLAWRKAPREKRAVKLLGTRL